MPNMGIDSLKANLTNPARTYLWEVLVPVPIGDGDSEIFTIRAQSSEIPSRSYGEIQIQYKQTPGIKVAGKLQYDQSWSCTFVEGEDKKVFDALQSWQQQVVDNKAGTGAGDPNYKADVYITTIKTDGDIYMKLKLKGAWVQEVAKVSLDYSNNETIKYNVTFAFDRWEDAT